MPIKNFWIVCKMCKHQVSLFSVFHSANFDEDIQSKISSLKCSKCGVKGHAKFVNRTRDVSSEFIASRSKTKFHTTTCGQMRHVSNANTLVFSSRQAAIHGGFQPCASCRP